MKDKQDFITFKTILFYNTVFNRIKGYRTNMHVFENHNELTKTLLFLWSYYNIENRYIKVRRLNWDQNSPKIMISATFRPYHWVVCEYKTIKIDKANMHVFEDHNKLTHSFIFFWSYYNIENRYRKLGTLNSDQKWTKSRISSSF